MKKVLIWILSGISFILILIFIGQGVQNHAISCEEAIENSKSMVGVQEKRRFDLIPNLVECVKDYSRHEYETLTRVISERGLNSGVADEVKVLVEAVAEAYPDLKAQKNYQDLMNELALTENKISKARDQYNHEVTGYRNYVRRFPSRPILRLLGYEIKDYKRLEFENTSTDAPKIDFK